MKSIMQKSKECYLTGSTYSLEKHHCIFGNANRKLSEKYGLTVWLTSEMHRGTNGVHNNSELALLLKKEAQVAFEREHGTRKEFLQIFGKNYL